MAQRRDKEEEYLRMREQRSEEYDQMLTHLRITDTEDYNAIKKKLETDVQVSVCMYVCMYVTMYITTLTLHH